MRAMKILSACGRRFDYTPAEYVAACNEVGYGA